MTTKRIIATVLQLAAASLLLPTSGAGAQDLTTDPDSVKLVVDDMRRLAAVLRSLEGGGDTTAVLERDYFANATPGLRAYAERYSVTAASLKAAIAENPARYARLDALADAISARRAEFDAAFRRLQQLYPDAVFAPIWFVAGNSGPGGLARPIGVLIAAERFVDDVDYLLPLVVHELAHIQAAVAQGIETYRRIYGPEQTLLALALREGSADLIAELVTGGHTNPQAEAYGSAHEAELWQRFQREMHERDPGDWMFVTPSQREWPPGLGYWMGYRITKAHYERVADKARAMRDLIELTDFRGFLANSGYDPR